MRYSVYDHRTRTYDYYEDGRTSGTHAGTPPVRSRTPLIDTMVATPEQAAWLLPMGARKVGAGELPIGRIATAASVGGLGDLTDDPVRLGLVAVLAYVAWRNFR